MTRPFDQEQDGLRHTFVVVDEAAAWEEFERVREQLELGEPGPFVIVTGGRRSGLLERAWWWLSWREELRVPRWALFVVPALATWGVVQLLTAGLEAIA